MMELKEPKSKKSKFRLEPKSSLPLVFGNKGELTKFHANLTALGSCIADPVEIEMIYKMGYFGKGSLSKSHPSFGRTQQRGTPPVTRKRQWQRRQEWICDVQKLSDETFYDNKNEISQLRLNQPSAEHEKDSQNNKTDMKVEQVVLDSTEDEDVISEASVDNHDTTSYFNKDCFSDENCDVVMVTNEYNRNDSNLQGQVLVLSDSDSETEDYLINIKPEIKYESFPVRETLHLTAEETFFLKYGLGCLRVMDFDGKYLSIGQSWNYFCKEQARFLQKYVTYHYFRSKGWIVKPGLSYGGDYLLYKDGPPFYHSSYIVIIDVLDAATLKRIEIKSVRNMTWNNFIGLQRLAETVKKEVLIAQVLWPPTVPVDTVPTCPQILSQFTVKEILWRRWKQTFNRFSGHQDEYSDEDNYLS